MNPLGHAFAGEGSMFCEAGTHSNEPSLFTQRSNCPHTPLPSLHSSMSEDNFEILHNGCNQGTKTHAHTLWCFYFLLCRNRNYHSLWSSTKASNSRKKVHHNPTFTVTKHQQLTHPSPVAQKSPCSMTAPLNARHLVTHPCKSSCLR